MEKKKENRKRDFNFLGGPGSLIAALAGEAILS